MIDKAIKLLVSPSDFKWVWNTQEKLPTQPLLSLPLSKPYQAWFQTSPWVPLVQSPHLTGERQRLKQRSQRPKAPWVSRSRPATHLLCCNALIFSYYSHLLEICPDAFFKGNSKKTKPENKKPFILHQTHSRCLGYSNHKLAIHEAHLLRIGFGWVERDVRTSRSSYL